MPSCNKTPAALRPGAIGAASPVQHVSRISTRERKLLTHAAIFLDCRVLVARFAHPQQYPDAAPVLPPAGVPVKCHFPGMQAGPKNILGKSTGPRPLERTPFDWRQAWRDAIFSRGETGFFSNRRATRRGYARPKFYSAYLLLMMISIHRSAEIKPDAQESYFAGNPAFLISSTDFPALTWSCTSLAVSCST